MAGVERHIFPGNHTPEGFFSYYQYIFDRHEAGKIICVKGGPKSGKSAFIKKIGELMLQEGCTIDFMHCALDSHNLDGIILADKKITVIDGTSNHAAGLINPDKIESVIHLEDFWDEEGVRKNQDVFTRVNESIRGLLNSAYHYLAAAGKMYDNLNDIYDSSINYEALYRISAKIIGEELTQKEISAKQGNVVKYFASAITPAGFTNYLETLFQGYQKIYFIHAPAGVSSERMLNLFMESAVNRGFDAEGYYCSMKPSEKLEHLLIPGLGLAFLTSNPYHTVNKSILKADVIPVDLRNIIRYNFVRHQEDILLDSKKRMDELLERGIDCLNLAKKEQDELDKYYVPNMDFLKIDLLKTEIAQKFRQ